MTKVMVIGNAGGGKSTLCRAVCAVHNLPCFSIDRFQWQPGWVPTPPAEFERRHEEILACERWLLDGYGPWSSVERRLEACDTVILVDHAIGVHFWWAARRQVKSLFVAHPDGPDGCPMWPVTVRLFRMMWWLHREMRPRLIEAIYKRANRIRIIHIKSPAELNAFTNNPV